MVPREVFVNISWSVLTKCRDKKKKALVLHARSPLHMQQLYYLLINKDVPCYKEWALIINKDAQILYPVCATDKYTSSSIAQKILFSAPSSISALWKNLLSTTLLIWLLWRIDHSSQKYLALLWMGMAVNGHSYMQRFPLGAYAHTQ